ncbi:MAG: flavohemoglobin expression-modulating QEGLA motif protein [Ardenticatenales bacterium]
MTPADGAAEAPPSTPASHASAGHAGGYAATIRALSDRIVEAQRPIRILDAIKWDDGVRVAFFAAGCAEPPPVDGAYYAAHPLPFDPAALRDGFYTIENDIHRELGQFNPVARIMARMCREYRSAIRMLEARGTPEFARLSQHLYGSAHDVFYAGEPTLADLGTQMTAMLDHLQGGILGQGEAKDIDGETAAALLQERLDAVFDDPAERVRVVVSDGIVADAAAGADYIKMRSEAWFNERDLRLLEIHEGWVHVGTTLNGRRQPVCTFLSKGPPSSTVTQEGLAMLMEVLCFASHPARMRRLTNRIHAVSRVEDGATFLDVFRMYRDQGFDELESYTNATRVFRGSTPDGGPFTKDISYSKGFVLIYNYVRLCVKRGLVERIPLLFCGKTTLEDIHTLAALVDEGIVVPPRYLPPQVADLNALVAWLSYSNFIGQLDLRRIEADYAQIL